MEGQQRDLRGGQGSGEVKAWPKRPQVAGGWAGVGVAWGDREGGEEEVELRQQREVLEGLDEEEEGVHRAQVLHLFGLGLGLVLGCTALRFCTC